MREVVLRLLAYLVISAGAGVTGWLAIALGAHLGTVGTIVCLAGLVSGIAIGLALLRAGAATRPDDVAPVNPARMINAMDAVSALAGAIAVFFIADGFSERIGGPASLLDEPLAADVTAVMFLPAALVLALFVSQAARQGVEIDEDGLRIAGVSGRTRAGWHEIIEIRPERQYVLVSRLGLPIPRLLRVNVVIETRDGAVVKIVEPGLKSARRHIMMRIRHCAPTRLAERFGEIEKAWNL